MLSLTIFICPLLLFTSAVSAFPPGSIRFPPPPGPPAFPKDVPPGFDKVLPPNALTELRAVHQNDKLTWQQKHEKIDAIMSSLPDEVLDKLPLPPGFEKLPQEVQSKLRAVHKERGLNWQAKHQKIHSIIHSLPEDQKRLLPPPPPPPGFDKLPQDVQAKLKAIHEDRSLPWPERRQKIHSIIQSLPEEQRRLLPSLPPWHRRFKSFQKMNSDQ